MALILKIYEELDEIARDAANPEEYADLMEALFELGRINGVDMVGVVDVMKTKRELEGGFHLGMIWTEDVPALPKWPPEGGI